MRETWVQSLSWEDPRKRAWPPALVFLHGESPWTKEPGGLRSTGTKKGGHDWSTKHMHYSLFQRQTHQWLPGGRRLRARRLTRLTKRKAGGEACCLELGLLPQWEAKQKEAPLRPGLGFKALLTSQPPFSLAPEAEKSPGLESPYHPRR